MNILFIDTETNSLPIKYNASYEDVNNWPRIIQIAWILTDGDGVVLKQRCDLIKPNGWEIPKEKFWIDNGFSTESSLVAGIKIEDALHDFYDAMDSASLVVAHNLNFDLNIVFAEMLRIGLTPKSEIEKFCTMTTTANLCRIPHANGRGYKWPKLIELHEFLFDTGFDGAHDALADVVACRDCFIKLMKIGLYSHSETI